MILNRPADLARASAAVRDALEAAGTAYLPETNVVLNRPEDDDDEVVAADTLGEACALIGEGPLGGGTSFVANGVRFGIFLHGIKPGEADAVVISYPDRYQGRPDIAAFMTSLVSRIDARLGPAQIRQGSGLVSPSSVWHDLVERHRGRA